MRALHPTPRPSLPETPHVLVLLVADGKPNHLVSTLRTLRAQTYPLMDVVAVDDTEDPEVNNLLTSRLGQDRVLVPTQRLGYARAVNVALRDPMVTATGMQDADLLLIMRADVALTPDAIAWMVRRIQNDPDLAIVGPKIRAWTEVPTLGSFGMSADRFGYPEGAGEPGELDQGQYDDRTDALWVSSACLLIRHDTYRELGGFDSRYDHVGEDLDLCWRARILGWQVGVSAEAVVYEAPRDDDPVHLRYLETRNTLTTRIKNLPTGRLITTQILAFVAGLFTLVWLLLTRHFGQAGAMVRGWLWALAQWGPTHKRRRAIQRLRRVREAEIDPLRVRGLPRLNRLIGTLVEPYTQQDRDEQDDQWSLTDPLADQPFQRFLRDQSLILLGLPILITLIFSTAPFWAHGQISGGQLAPWPDGRSWLTGLIAGFPLAPIGQVQPASPTAWLLAALSALIPGSGWIAQRLLFFSLPVLAWLGTMALGRHLTDRLAPRVFAGAVIATSPLLIGAMGAGNVDLALALALTPGLTSAGLSLTHTGNPAPAWRSTAYWAFMAALLVGTGPIHALWILGPLMVLMVLRALRPQARMGLIRLSVATLSAVVLVGPWLRTWLHGGALTQSLTAPDGRAPDWVGALTGQPGVAVLDTLAKPGFADLGLLSLLQALWPLLIPVLVVVAAFTIGLRRNPLAAGLATLAMVIGAYGLYGQQLLPHPINEARLSWDLALSDGAGGLWLAGVGVLVVLTVQWASWTEGTRTRTSWWGMGLSALLLVGISAQTITLAQGPWSALHTQDLIPAFVQREADHTGPQRVIRLGRDQAGRLEWAVMMNDGPSMGAYGQFDDPTWVEAINRALPSAVRQIGSDAGTVLGAMGVRWIVLDGSDEGLTSALSAQSWLDRVPSTTGVVYRVATWQPLLSVPNAETAQRLRLGGGLAATTQAEAPFTPEVTRTRDGYALRLEADHGDLLLFALAPNSRWRAMADGKALDPVPPPTNGDSPGVLGLVHAWTLPSDARYVTVHLSPEPTQRIIGLIQGLVLLALLSLALRPPGRQRHQDPVSGDLPEELADIADNTGPIPVITPNQGDVS